MRLVGMGLVGGQRVTAADDVGEAEWIAARRMGRIVDDAAAHALLLGHLIRRQIDGAAVCVGRRGQQRHHQVEGQRCDRKYGDDVICRIGAGGQAWMDRDGADVVRQRREADMGDE